MNKSLYKNSDKLLKDKYKELNDNCVYDNESNNNTEKRNAIILAAGYGMRMVPINTEIPKGLIDVNGQRLIDRLIEQLHDVNITDIIVVVGFMKDMYEYLIDKYSVKLVVNMDYSNYNNLHSLNLILSKLSNTFIIPCDVWCFNNPFNYDGATSWYMITDDLCKESNIRLKNNELVCIDNKDLGNHMIGISYINRKDSIWIKNRIKSFSNNYMYDNSYWEEVLYFDNKMRIQPRLVSAKDTYEINTYEQLREIDSSSNQLKTEAITIIQNIFSIENNSIYNIKVLKKGMTNRSFSFEVDSKCYIMRVPGEGTDKLINRRHEYDVYQVIKDQHICDPVIYMNPDNGYKITEYIEDAHACDASYFGDVANCMKKLRDFHNKKLVVNHTFEVFEELEKYESYWQGMPSIYRDYEQTKKHIYELKEFVDAQPKEWGLSHIDSVPDNFLFSKDSLYLIDWEYAGMQDQHIDIAMFAIYSLYDRNDVETLIDLYFDCECDDMVRIKIYAYIAICGLLWSNWCEYKRNLGVEFGEYSLKQYRYAKEYYRIVKEALEERGMKLCTK